MAVTASDLALVNILRYGLLALKLLPEKSNAGIIVITDGMLNVPNATVLESMLNQFRHQTISCSFLQVGSNPHPRSCLGLVPYNDLLKFISSTTFGAYLPFCPEVRQTKESHASLKFSKRLYRFHNNVYLSLAG